MKTLIVLFLYFVVLSSCMDETFPTDYETQIVRKGNNYCDNSQAVIYSFMGRKYLATVKLDTSLFVHNEGAYQNKLLGFSESSDVQYNSARVTFHTLSDPTDSLKDELILKTYVYNNGKRLTDEKYTIELLRLSYLDVLAGLGHDSIRFEIEMTDKQYLFKVNNGQQVSMPRVGTLPLDSPKYILKLYYGGTPTAPHDMSIKIKYDRSIKGKAENIYKISY